jgi:hypothetical protein
LNFLTVIDIFMVDAVFIIRQRNVEKQFHFWHFSSRARTDEKMQRKRRKVHLEMIFRLYDFSVGVENGKLKNIWYF